jgi:LSD1 subclass zinc finger protein
MGLFKRLSGQQVAIDPKSSDSANSPSTPAHSPGVPDLSGVPDLTEELKRQLKNARARVFAYSDMVKQVDCARCGAPKQLPSKTAYVYCDHCGALTDYDFRIGNFDTNAALTNQVFAYLVAPVQPALDISSATGDKQRYRSLLTPVYAEWVRQCPQANSPRATSDPDFQQRQVNYLVECMVARDFDKSTAQIGQQLVAATRALQRIPQPDGSFYVSDGIWQVAALYKQQMEMSYKLLEDQGVMALDPEEAPVAVWLKMEYSYFCQNWLPKIPPADADRFLDFFGLKSEYSKMNVTTAETKKCGGCGDELKTVPGAQAVVCESCGKKLDIAGGEVPCQNCGAPLSFPVRTSAIDCPYCHTTTHRA